MSVGSNIVAYYDLKNAPITFDFCHYIAAASAYARLNNQPTFDLVVIADGYRNITPREQSYTLADRRWRLWNLIVEVAKVVPQIGSISVLNKPPDLLAANTYPPTYRPPDNTEIPYNTISVRNFFDLGLEVRIFRPSEYAVRSVARMLPQGEGRIVTITLRKAGYDSARDSKLEEWYEFSRLLKDKGFRPVIIPDQDDVLADRSISRFDWYVIEPAAMSADLRLALYHRASMNYVTNNGIIGLLMYSTAPFAWFSVIVDGAPSASPRYYKAQAMNVGDKYPWFGEHQHMFWERETLENLADSIRLIP